MKQSYEDLSQAYDKTLIGWSKALELRDECTEGHTQRVADLTMLICRLFGINEPELTKIRYGVLLHDIGKIGIPDAILNKPGKLNEEEWMVMRKHPDYGREILKDIPFLVDSLDIPYYHHERWDGTGYPCGLRGTEIPLPARIFSVIDVWDGMTNKRPYHDGHTNDEAVKYIQHNSGKHFDPEVVKRFMYYLEQQNQDNFIV